MSEEFGGGPERAGRMMRGCIRYWPHKDWRILAPNGEEIDRYERPHTQFG